GTTSGQPSRPCPASQRRDRLRQHYLIVWGGSKDPPLFFAPVPTQLATPPSKFAALRRASRSLARRIARSSCRAPLHRRHRVRAPAALPRSAHAVRRVGHLLVLREANLVGCVVALHVSEQSSLPHAAREAVRHRVRKCALGTSLTGVRGRHAGGGCDLR